MRIAGALALCGSLVVTAALAAQQTAMIFLVPPSPPPYAPPAYVDTSAFTESEITVGSGAFALPGTLTMPRGHGTVPVVVLVHGSGPNDRDETVGANRPFRDLAWGLASRGIAVVRYDKRTRAHPAQPGATGGGGGAPLTPEWEVIDDALLALAVARAQPGVNSRRVFLLGHSLGGLLGPEIAKRDGRLAGLVLLAAPAHPFVDLLTSQFGYLRSIAPSGAERAALDSQAALVARVARSEVPADSNVLGAPAGYWYDLNRRDGVATARGLRCPLLLLQGGRDYQVTTADLDRWRAALPARATFRLYPDLNHLFITGAGTATPAEYTLGAAGHVAPIVVGDVARWITSTNAP